jgi:hypothetical protein
VLCNLLIFLHLRTDDTDGSAPAYSVSPSALGEADMDRNTKLLIMAALGLALLASYSAQALVF